MLHGHGIGSVLNETFRLERELGRSSLGTVYAGSNLVKGTECAIRVFPPEARDLVIERERFLRDHKVVAQLGDPRLPGIEEMAITQDGIFFVVTELWRGETLRQRLRRGGLPAGQVFSLFDTLCEALGKIHERGVPHGDLSPGNVVLGRGAEGPVLQDVQIVDLGLHHFRVGPLRVFPKRAPGVGWYVAPERVESRMREADPRGDVFALGAIFYEALTGRPAFLEPPASTAMRERSGLNQLRKTGGQAVPELELFLDTACATGPADRFADAQALGTALRALSRTSLSELAARRLLPTMAQPADELALPAAPAPAPAAEEAVPSGDSPVASSRRSRRRPLLGGTATPEAAELSTEAESQPNPVPVPSPPAPEVPEPAAGKAADEPAAPPPPAPEEDRPPAPQEKAAQEKAPEKVQDKALSPVAARLQALARGEARPLSRDIKGRLAGRSAPAPTASSQPPEAAPSSQTAVIVPSCSATPAETVPVVPQQAGLPSADSGDKAAEAAKAIAAARRAAAARLLEAARSRARKSGEAPGAASSASPVVFPPPDGFTLPDLVVAPEAPAGPGTPPHEGPAPQAKAPMPAPAATAVPTPVGLTPSARRRRAPADLKEQPPAAGEVIAQPREVPPLDSGQVIIDLTDVPGDPPSSRPVAVSAPRRMAAPPPLPAEVSQSAIPASAIADVQQALKATSALPLPAPLPQVLAAPPVAESAAPVAPAARPTRPMDSVQRTAEVELVLRPAPRSPWSLLWAALVGALLVFGVGCYVLLHFFSSPPRDQVEAPRPLPPPPPPKVVDDTPQRLADIDRALGAEDFRSALRQADEGLGVHPGSAPLLLRRGKAETELQNQFRYDGFRAAVEHHNNEVALALFAEIPDTSVYHEKAGPQAAVVRGEYVAARLAEAKAARRLNLCDEVQRQVHAILALMPDNEAATELQGKCERPPPEPKATGDQRGHRPSRRPGEGGKPPPPPAEESHSTLKDLRDPFQ